MTVLSLTKSSWFQVVAKVQSKWGLLEFPSSLVVPEVVEVAANPSCSS